MSRAQSWGGRGRAAGIIALLVVPNLVWALVDEHVWPWDQAHYGFNSVRLWNEIGAGGWITALLHTSPELEPEDCDLLDRGSAPDSKGSRMVHGCYYFDHFSRNHGRLVPRKVVNI